METEVPLERQKPTLSKPSFTEYISIRTPTVLQEVLRYFIFNCFISLLIGLIAMFIALGKNERYFDEFVMCIVDMSRLLYYVMILALGRRYPKVTVFGAYGVPILFSVIITEVYIYIDLAGYTLERVLSNAGVYILQAAYSQGSLWVTSFPGLFSIIYPFLRCTNFHYLKIICLINVRCLWHFYAITSLNYFPNFK